MKGKGSHKGKHDPKQYPFGTNAAEHGGEYVRMPAKRQGTGAEPRTRWRKGAK